MEKYNRPNDTINLEDTSKIDIAVKILSKPNDREMVVDFYGTSMGVEIINSIRRAIDHVPIMGFPKELVEIDNEITKTVLDIGSVSVHIAGLPIYDLPSYHDMQNPETYITNSVLANMFADYTRNTYLEDVKDEEMDENTAGKNLMDIQFHLEYHNKTDKTVNVTTHHGKLYIDGQKSDSYLTSPPIYIFPLFPGESIALRAKAAMGIATIPGPFESCTRPTHSYKDDDDSHCTLRYSKLGSNNNQISLLDILIKANRILQIKCEKLREYVHQHWTPGEKNNLVILHGEDHTLGFTVAKCLQKYPHVESAAFVRRNMDKKIGEIVINLKSKSPKDTKKVMIEACDYLHALYQKILDQINSAQ